MESMIGIGKIDIALDVLLRCQMLSQPKSLLQNLDRRLWFFQNQQYSRLQDQYRAEQLSIIQLPGNRNGFFDIGLSFLHQSPAHIKLCQWKQRRTLRALIRELTV